MTNFIQGLFIGYGLACFILLINYLVTKQRAAKMEEQWLNDISNVGYVEKIKKSSINIKKLI
jgi:hypothetical protein